MAKALKDILQQAHDRIKGVHASQTSPGSLGKDPGVDYDPKSGDEQDFVAKHSVQKWDEPSGNPNYADSVKYVLDKEKNHGYTERKAEKVNESKKAEDVKCNHTPAKTWCPMHEMADCSMSKTIKEEEITEISKKTLMSYGAKASKQIRGNQPSDPDKFRKRTNRENGIKLANKKYFGYKSVPATEEVEKVIDNGHTPVYHDQQIHAGQVIKKKTGRKVYFDGGDMVDHKTNKTITKNALGKHPIHKLVQHASEFKEEVELDEKMSDTQKTAVKAIQKYRDKAGIAKPSISDTKRTVKFVKQNANEEVELDEKAVSKAQQRLFGMALAMRRGDSDTGSSKVAKLASDLSQKKLKDFAKTKTTNLPLHKEDLAVPLLGSAQPPRGDSEEAIEMVKTELKALANKAMHLVSQMPSNMHVEPWCQAKIAQAKSMVSDVHDYMIYGDHEEDEQMDTPMTFPNMSVDVNTGQNV
jgi:hypothetical protein